MLLPSVPGPSLWSQRSLRRSIIAGLLDIYAKSNVAAVGPSSVESRATIPSIGHVSSHVNSTVAARAKAIFNNYWEIGTFSHGKQDRNS
jgi:hypothetical protein